MSSFWWRLNGKHPSNWTENVLVGWCPILDQVTGMTASRPIESLPNLGPKSSQWLRQVGIASIAELERLGPVLAYRLVKQRQPRTSLNLLWALAAGLEGEDWRKLTVAKKKQFREAAEEE